MSDTIKHETNLPSNVPNISNVAMIEDLGKFKKMLSKQPDSKKVKEHPFINIKVKGQNQPYKYLPIEEIQNNLDSLFMGLYSIEVRSTSTFVNSVMVTVRINYFHPVFKMWLFVDGVGASSLQVNKDSNPTDLNQLKQDSVVMALPKAKTEALKNAAKELGNKFGRTLNKDTQSEFILIDSIQAFLTGVSIDDINKQKEYERIKAHILNSKSLDVLEQVEEYCEAFGLLQEYYTQKDILKVK